MLPLIRVYLDTKYWVYLRDAAIGRSVDPEHDRLLAILRDLVGAGVAICPISDVVFYELVRQGDPARRLASARIMDELSLGVALQPHDHRLTAELAYFYGELTGLHGVAEPPERIVWTRTPFLLGCLMPYPEWAADDESLRQRVHCAFFEYQWAMRLEELLGEISECSPLSRDWADELAANLTAGKLSHAHELRSEADALRAEIIGAVEASQEIIGRIPPVFYERVTGRRPPTRCDDDPTLRRLIVEVLLKDDGLADVPSLRIQAGIHAAIRWRLRERFEGNDWFDFMHASAALPYCSVFLTERKLASRLLEHGYDRRYRCRVVYKARSAWTVIESLVREREKGATAAPVQNERDVRGPAPESR